jgi:hypothetical protein
LKPTSFVDASTNSPSLRAFLSLYISVCLCVCLFLSFCVFLSLISPRELLQACLRVMHPRRVHPSPQHWQRTQNTYREVISIALQTEPASTKPSINVLGRNDGKRSKAKTKKIKKTSSRREREREREREEVAVELFGGGMTG